MSKIGGFMDKMWNFVEKNLGKAITIPIALNGLEFLMMLIHSMSDGVIDHSELEALLKVGDGVSILLLTLVMGYLKFKKK